MKKLSESVWNDIRKRGLGDEIKKEDDLTEKDRKDLDKLIVSYAKEFVYGKGYSFNFFKMNTDAGNLDEFCYYIESDNEVEDLDKDKILQYVKDYWADKLCKDVSGAIEQAELEYHQNMNESVWGDIRKRGLGDEIKKEDEVGNIKKLKPIDMGGSVLWADDDIFYDGECLFTFDEAFELVKNSGWRLPTLQDVAELDILVNRGQFKHDNSLFYFENENGDVLKFIRRGIYLHTVKSHITDFGVYYYGWTSDLYKMNSAHIFTFDNEHIYHSPVYDKRVVDQVVQDTSDKCCIRLVKDK